MPYSFKYIEKYYSSMRFLIAMSLCGTILAISDYANADNYNGTIVGCLDQTGHLVTCSNEQPTTYQQSPAELERQRRIAEAQDMNTQGTRAYNQRDWQNAVGYFQAALKDDPGSRQYKDNLIKAQEALKRQQQQDQEHREHEQFLNQRNATASMFKDDHASNTELKTEMGTNFFGAYGGSSETATDELRPLPHGQSTKKLKTAWQQIHCSAEIASNAIDDAASISNSSNAGEALADVKFLAQQSSNAMNGNSIQVQCADSSPPEGISINALNYNRNDLHIMLGSLVTDAESLYDSSTKEKALARKIGEAQSILNKHTSPPSDTSTNNKSNQDLPATAPSNDSAQQSYQEQNAQIRDTVDKQKQMQQRQDNALAILREAQLELNKINSEKSNAQNDLLRLKQKTQEVLGQQ